MSAFHFFLPVFHPVLSLVLLTSLWGLTHDFFLLAHFLEGFFHEQSVKSTSVINYFFLSEFKVPKSFSLASLFKPLMLI